ncbi:MAG: dTDP-glucose 4,6-dehydratase [Nitrospiraceae bacterium]|nr:MAG: dTDP-glucose 4,6-dehydratase [Nitrospiraceae bacterium]
MMKIMVTGGAGFIGSNFIRHMLTSYPEHSILNLDNLTYAGNLENLKGIESLSHYTFIKGDIADARLLESIEFDAIINFAAESHVDRSILNAYPFLQTNVIGTQCLLEAAKKRKCRILHVSTDEVYGSIEEGLFIETSTVLPNSPYAASKASADLLARAYHETYGLDVSVTRCSNNYGPYQFPEKLIPLVILNAIEGKQIPVYGDGKNVRDWIHVSDHCKAIDLIFHKGKAGTVYNVGARNEVQNIDIIKKILMIMDEKKRHEKRSFTDLIAYVQDRPGHDRRYAIDPTKVETELGWRPEIDFDKGISSTVEWYMENREWWKSILSGEYMDYYKQQYDGRFRE